MDIDQVLGDVCAHGAKYVDFFYDNYDHDRAKLLQLFGRDSQIVFDGQIVKNDDQVQDKIGQFLQQLPTSTHVRTTLDCQPLFDPEGNYRGIHATVSGTITFHGEMEKSFIETIILVRSDEQNYYINTVIFRSAENL
ncbi:MAG: hypothetical protein EZS28_006028 [Streblomastix strix]|uniref:NTF2-related export protein n=1 Tax=Streblomastix strix TaxID=222440 RepID=A0A5J4WU67_9EUKA|nr:MAG: hypothetical protein EZS28_006028 [Streblomastix strix]